MIKSDKELQDFKEWMGEGRTSGEVMEYPKALARKIGRENAEEAIDYILDFLEDRDDLSEEQINTIEYFIRGSRTLPLAKFELQDWQLEIHKHYEDQIKEWEEEILDPEVEECVGCLKAYREAWVKTWKRHEEVKGWLDRPVAYGVGWTCEVCGEQGVTN